jgi:DNA primase catalytic core
MKKITLEELRKLVKIEDIVSKYVKIEKRGKYLKAICPFHKETEPSFTITPERNQFYCFGCKEKGDAFDFLMKINNYTFIDALKEIADMYNVEVDNRYIEMRDEKQAIFDINKMFMVECIKNIEKIKKYLHFRGLNDNTILNSKLGYCKNGAEIYKKLITKFTEEQIRKANLFSIFKTQKTSIFENRIIIPITEGKNIIGFGARRLDDNDTKQAKYMNSFNNLVFDKSKILYKTETSMCKGEHLLIVEGYFDVMMLNQIGFGNVVGLNGTSISNYQLNKIKNSLSTGSFYLMLDGDKAGIKAMLNMVDEFIKNDIDIKLLILPDGQDPCGFIKNNIKSRIEFDEYLNHHKKDGLCFKIDMILKKYNLKSHIEKQKAFIYIENWLYSFDKYFVYEKGIEHLIVILDIDYKKFMEKFKKRNKDSFNNKEHKLNLNDELRYQLRLIKLFIDYPDKLYEYIDNVPVDYVFTKPVLRKVFKAVIEIIRVKDYGVLQTNLEGVLSNVIENYNDIDKKAIKLIKDFVEKNLYEDVVTFMMETLKLIRLFQIDKEIQKMKKSLDNIVVIEEKLNILKRVDLLTDKKNHIKLDM